MPRSFHSLGLYSMVVLVWTALFALGLTPWWERVEENSFDWLTVATSPAVADSPITIVGIDEPSFAEFQQQWPWPRAMHAELIDRLKEQGAKVIAFDVVFAEPSAPAQDRRLAEAIRRAGNVVLAADWEQREDAHIEQQREILPLQSLLEAGATTGIAKVPLSGSCIRRFPAFDNAFGKAILDAAGIPVDPQRLPQPGLIRYAAPPQGFSYASYYQALHPKQFLPRGFFKDRIVLVGMVLDDSPQLQADMYCTPYSWRNMRRMPGVEINANVIDAAMRGRVLGETGQGARAALLAGLMLLSLLAFRQWSPRRAGLRLLLLGGACIVTAAGLFVYADLWWPFFAPLLGLFLTWLLFGAAAFIEERRKRTEIRRAFGHYVSSAVIDQMLAHPEQLRLGGERREITVLFTDLAGFTSVSEKLQPEEVAEMLNLYLTAMGRIILDHGGTLDKFIGDAVMAFWGAPLLDADHALHACRAALQMQQAMDAVNATLKQKGLGNLSMRIGIHTGSAVVGNMGSVERFDYTAIGDTVNLASRLEGANKLYGTGILLSHATVDALQGDIACRPIDKICVKGKREPIEVYTFGIVSQDNDAAIQAFRRQDWEASERLWQRVLHDCPSDPVALLYLERIAALRSSPPVPDWDGSIALDVK
ncbi:MAG TPA: adenylate/guanylate cyclase domain-containing protein [Noviherbaspirillum sp.]|uniref:adenylate/guanylate cyclase domain-containing protein n=1 Tax=Noviherbaspirillum sp. TaxID=1926288 RepID=UPI002B46AFF8|nr:adenylate/guanylate cyclase domain-containing protein [Noviherbaspirillum sp.]HJV86427.1 adenylate/guanylate cyclase domain-containing protein [Noviherbaspirillum sp.]